MFTQLLGLASLTAILGAFPPGVWADEATPEPYARVEVRGKLGQRTDTERGVNIYQVTLGKGETAQVYYLVLPDDAAMRKSAKDLDGQEIVVTGDLQVKLVFDFKKRSGTPNAIGELKVKTLKKAGAEAPKKEEKGDAAKLIGKWQAISGEQSGKPMKKADYENFGLEIDARVFTYLSGGKSFRRHHYTIDPAAKPKMLDLQTIDTRALFSSEGIYELEGDTLKICIGGKKRPTEFATDDKGSVLYVLKRQ